MVNSQKILISILLAAVSAGCVHNRATQRDTPRGVERGAQAGAAIDLVTEDRIITGTVTTSNVAGPKTIEELLEDAEFLYCYDGDTCKINIPDVPDVLGGKKMGLRIWGVDTPELRGKCRKEKQLAVLATKLTNQAVFNAQRIEYSEVKRGKFYRLVARLRIDGAYLDETLIAAGLGVPYFGKTKSKDWCK